MNQKHTPGLINATKRLKRWVLKGIADGCYKNCARPNGAKIDIKFAEQAIAKWELSDEAKANARLIASAPELLEAAKDALDIIKHCVDWKYGKTTEMRLKRVIAKAEDR